MIRTAGVLLAMGLLAQQAPTDGLVGYWKLDDSDGETAADSSGKGNPGKRAGGVKSSPEVPKNFANARTLSFDGKNGRVNVGERVDLAMKKAVILTAWVRPTANSEINAMILNREGEYEIWRSVEGNLEYALANDAPGWNATGTNVALPLNVWKHIALT